MNNCLQKSSWKDGSIDKVSYGLGWKQSFLSFKNTGLHFLHVRTYMSLKLSLLQKLMPSLSPLPQRWPMALLHILLKEHRSNWKTDLRPIHGAPPPPCIESPQYGFAVFQAIFMWHVISPNTKQYSCFFSRGNITSRYAHLLLTFLLIWVWFWYWYCIDQRAL